MILHRAAHIFFFPGLSHKILAPSPCWVPTIASHLLWGPMWSPPPELALRVHSQTKCSLAPPSVPFSLAEIDRDRCQCSLCCLWVSEPIRRERATALVHITRSRLGSGIYKGGMGGSCTLLQIMHQGNKKLSAFRTTLTVVLKCTDFRWHRHLSRACGIS